MVSARRVAPILLLAVMIPAFGAKPTATPKSSSHPPRELHRVGDHWTPYNPPDPSSYPPNAKTYTIKAGDTLWGLATQFYQNGYLWPQLWESNTWITDAHWIYPGDVLLVQGEVARQVQPGTAGGGGQTGAGTAGAAGTEATAGTGPTGGRERELGAQAVQLRQITAADAVGGTATPVPLGTEYDIYCYGYIGDPRERMPNSVSSYEDVEMRYLAGALRQSSSGSTGDLVYLNGGTSTGLMAGETYLAVMPDELVENPRTNEVIGRHYQFVGQIRVLCAEERRSRGIITQSCHDVPVGTRLKPMPQLPIPLARIPSMPAFCDPASGKTTGYIVHALAGTGMTAPGGAWKSATYLGGGSAIGAIGDGQLVQINLGRDDQVMPGDFLTVFRESPQRGQPRQILGEIGVLTSESHTATAKVLLMRRSMTVGDHVEIR
jgi:hypothetical protein